MAQVAAWLAQALPRCTHDHSRPKKSTASETMNSHTPDIRFCFTTCTQHGGGERCGTGQADMRFCFTTCTQHGGERGGTRQAGKIDISHHHLHAR